ncbi:MAG: ABC transporter family substrate-binding protein [Streptosporangiales bacterium]|nr:ABC transporter family substrate-binding protein [Streptosporangiales bacterium]
MVRRHRGRVALAAPLIALALVAGGCSTGGSEGNDTTTAELKTIDINPAARDKIKQGGTVRWGINEFLSQYNRMHNDGNNANLRTMDWGLMPQPFISDEKAAISPNPNFITGVKEETDPKQVITLTLNPKAKWSDGTEITWKDYASQAEAMSGRDTDYIVAQTTGWDRLESVERGKDDHEVVLTFKENYADWRGLYDPLIPAEYSATPEKFNKGYLEDMPLTAGPFKFDGLDKTAKTATISRDPNWWGEPAKLDKIIFRSMEDEALTGAFANGELDVYDVGPNASAYKRVSSMQGIQLRTAANPDFRHFTMNGESKKLSDARVRNAMFMAINREAIAQSDLKGLNWPSIPLNNHFFMNSQKGYKDNAGEFGKYNPEKAKQLLDQAGWTLPQGKRVREKGGEPLELTFVIPTGIAISQQEGQLAQAMLQEVGVKLNIEAVPSDDFFTKRIIPGNYDITPFSWIGTPFPVSGSEQQWSNAVENKKGEKQWGNNLARVGADETDAAMAKAVAELDPAKTIQYANQADALIWKMGNTLPLYQRPKITAVKANLANLGANGFKFIKYEDIGYTS